MKIYTSYFYQIRNFSVTLLPISVARHDPKWFHQGYGCNHIFIDNRGIINGLRLSDLAPSEHLSGLCCGPKLCTHLLDEVCPFLSAYYNELLRRNFDDIVHTLEIYSKQAKDVLRLDAVPDVALILYEAPDNRCSERAMLQQWFSEHGVVVTEWRG